MMISKRVAVATVMAVSMFLMGMAAKPQAAPAEVTAQAMQASVVADDEDNSIPEGAIRLRIIANSDRDEDQQLKRHIRDRVITAVAQEIRGLTDEEAAREKIRQAVPKMNEIAEQVIAEEGFSYTAQTDFGMVPFPTKMYGDKVYPAGDYEALRIQLGEAQGQNWWCVLFPPLCFVDMANGDAAPKDMEPGKKAETAVTTVEIKNAQTGAEEEVQVRSALLDKLGELWNKVESIFA